MMQRLERLIGLGEAVLAAMAAIIMALIMLIVATDVAMRYLLNSPLSWSYDIISLYLMAGLFYFALSRTYAEGAHISVDIVQMYLSDTLRRLCVVVYASLAAILFAVIGWLGFGRALDDYASGAATAGAVLWPTWLSDVLVPIGAWLITLRLIVNVALHVASLVSGRALIALPVLAESERGLAKGGFK